VSSSGFIRHKLPTYIALKPTVGDVAFDARLGFRSIDRCDDRIVRNERSAGYYLPSPEPEATTVTTLGSTMVLMHRILMPCSEGHCIPT
jgi:hypothetical protein